MKRLLQGVLLATLLPVASEGAITATLGTDPTRQVLIGKLVTPTGVVQGELVIERDTITCVAEDCPAPPGASIFTVTDAFIFPGFIDAHNHVAYNVLPKWTPPRLYSNRSQWQAAVSYKAFKTPYNTLKAKQFCDMVRWGEIAALMSGITSVQGTAPNQGCFKGLVRNIENQNDLGLPANHIRTFILDISSFEGSINWTKTRSFVVHLAEGVDEKSRKEFDRLKTLGLLRAETAIIHGTAFGGAEFEAMGKAGAKLIWSPQSNLTLYAATTNIPLALKYGIEVSLGVDWNASGSDTLFDELRVAEGVNAEQWAGVIPSGAWVDMITRHPARALAVDHLLGSLEVGKKADITILTSKTAAEPGDTVLASHLGNVEAVWIGGELLYGAASVVETMRPTGCEKLLVQGLAKRVCASVLQLVNVLGTRFPYLVPVAR